MLLSWNQIAFYLRYLSVLAYIMRDILLTCSLSQQGAVRTRSRVRREKFDIRIYFLLNFPPIFIVITYFVEWHRVIIIYSMPHQSNKDFNARNNLCCDIYFWRRIKMNWRLLITQYNGTVFVSMPTCTFAAVIASVKQLLNYVLLV